MQKMDIRKVKAEEIDLTLGILCQDNLRYCDGKYPEKERIRNFLTDKNCFAFGLYNDNRLLAVLLSEKLSFQGCMLWYLAVKPEEQFKGYGSALLEWFETYAKDQGINWIFLNATSEALKFYKKHKFITSEYSNVFEHVKKL